MRQVLLLAAGLFLFNSNCLRAVDEEDLEGFDTDRMICSLELLHQQGRGSLSASGSITWDAFYPFWVFDNAALDDLLEHLDPTDEHSTYAKMTAGAWTLAWEKAYEKKYGKLAARWVRQHFSGRRRFVQRLLVEIAYRISDRMGELDNPPWFTDRENLPTRVFETMAQLKKWFSSREEFQLEFDKVFRRRRGSALHALRTPTLARSMALKISSDDPRAIEDALPESIKRGLKSWEPRRRAYDSSRRKTDDLGGIADAIQEFGDADLPLAALFVETSDSDNERQIGFHWEFAQSLVQRHGGTFEKLVAVINVERALRQQYLIEVQEGAKNMAEEIAIQAGVAYVLASKLANFSGFHADDKTSPFYAGFGNEVQTRSRLSIHELNKRVFRRLWATYKR